MSLIHTSSSNDVDVSLLKEEISKKLDLSDSCIETIMCRMALRGWEDDDLVHDDPGNSPMVPILNMHPHGNVVCIVTFVKKKAIVLAREHDVIRLVVQHGKPVAEGQLTKEQAAKKAYDNYSKSKGKGGRGSGGGYGRGHAGGGGGGYGRGHAGGGGGGYGRGNAGRGGGYGVSNTTSSSTTSTSTSLSFNLDELVASTPKHSEKDVRRLLDRLRYQGEITTSWEGTALRARMIQKVPEDTAIIDAVARDLYGVANTLATSTVSKVEGMFKLATRAAVEYAPRDDPLSMLSMEGSENFFAAKLALLNGGLERYFQDKEHHENVDSTEIAAVAEVVEMSEYEMARLERIRRNNEEMVRLGLMDAADAMRNMTAARGGAEGDTSSSSSSSTASGGKGDEKKGGDDVVMEDVPLPFAVIDAAAAALLRSDVRVLLQNQILAQNSSTTPRVLTRIFHGLGSPAFESPDFWNTTFWNRHRRYEFNTLLEYVTKIMREMKLNGGKW